MPFVPSEASEPRDTESLRYLAVRVRPRQGDLFADGTAVKHFAVLSTLLGLGQGRGPAAPVALGEGWDD